MHESEWREEVIILTTANPRRSWVRDQTLHRSTDGVGEGGVMMGVTTNPVVHPHHEPLD